MKKLFLNLMQIVFVTTIFSCKSGGDKFVGIWIGCNHAEYSITVTKKEDDYVLQAKGRNEELILEKMADEVLSVKPNVVANSGKRLTLKYDKSTNHLFISQVVDHQERQEEFCKSENGK